MVPVGMRARALSTLGGSMRVGIFVGPFIGAGFMHFFGLASAYVVALVAVLGAGGSHTASPIWTAGRTTVPPMRRSPRSGCSAGTGTCS
ncbi:hypothetical protein [Tsukamurella soli]|uniref:hypothetical protein n=1 Tax=Tsukamurella soli TaxID=644556 RepID=UPI0036072744